MNSRVIDQELLLNILDNMFNKPIIEDWQIVQHNIVGNDPEDGGANHEVILKKVSENKFYLCTYFDWDKDYNPDDLDTELIEVFPKEKTITVYE